MLQYVLGINDPRTVLMIKVELLKYLMQFRELEPENMKARALNYLKITNKSKTVNQNM
jgi:hypothetical protein